ncbi:MAG TPA: hypothetical protein VFV38_50045 [Ktedonobacteraceae bacterium]|nr:hypothetical protein [Ktedonobacteraceae bacterium]
MQMHVQRKHTPSAFQPAMKRSLIRFFALLWRFIGWLWGTVIVGMLLGGTLGNAVYTFLTKGHFDPVSFAFLQSLIAGHLLVTIVLLLLLVGITLTSFLAHRASLAAPSLVQQSEYTLRPVRQLAPRNDEIFRYVPQAYIWREEDHKAREVLRELAHGNWTRSRQYAGICLFGKPGQGKTRCAWEAMQAELPNWLLVRWSHEHTTPLDFSQQKGKRLVLWIDDLHEFASTNEATLLNELPDRFHEAGAYLLVVATCRDGEDQTQADKHFNRLLEQLMPLTLGNIKTTQAFDLAKMLTEANIEVRGDEFDGTPGSLLFGPKRMQDRYRHLPPASQQILKTMKLLRSAGIYRYPEARVRHVASDLFEFDERNWQEALEKVVQGDFIGRRRLPSDEVVLVPLADIYVEKVVTDYPLPKETLVDTWPDLERSLKQSCDAEGLNSLGIAFAERLVGHLPANKRHAAACFHAALQVYTREQTPGDWAMTQNNLGNALSDQAAIAEGEEQTRLLTEAINAYRAALQVYTREQTPGDWAMTQNNLGVALRAQAAIAEGEEQARLLTEAISAQRAALQVRTREQTPGSWAMTQNNLGVALRAQAAIAEGAEQARLLTEAINAHRAALQVRTREQTPGDWAGTQNNLGNALRAQAAIAEGAEQAQLLEEAINAHRAALQVYTREQTPGSWAMTQNNLGVALGAQAAIAEGAEQAQLLEEAINAHRAALQVYSPEWTPGRFLAISYQVIVLLLTLALLPTEKERKDVLLHEAQRHLEQVVSRLQATLNADQRARLQTLERAIQESLDSDEEHE